MTIAWMLCYLAVGVLLAIVAAALDALAADLRYRRRFIWMGAMLAMCVLPVALPRIDAPLPLRDVTARAVRLPEALPTTAPIANAVNAGLQSHEPSLMLRVTRADRNAVVIEPGSVLRRGDLLLPALSLASSVACLVLLAGAARRMRHARRHWTLTDTATSELVSHIAGRRVRTWVSDGIGPAAFGVRRPQVVIPRWADTLDAPARTLLLTHEASHVAARDPLLLRIALGLVVVLPWNVALLYAYRRLHRAVEHDCDARVLRTTGDARGYGRLLIDAAEHLAAGGATARWSRAARWLPVAAAGIGVQRSDLELRLRALVRPVSTWQSRVRNVAAAMLTLGAGLAACSVPAPSQRGEQADATPAVTRGDTTAAMQSLVDSLATLDHAMLMSRPQLRVRRDSLVAAVARRFYPWVFEKEAREDFVWLLLDRKYSHAGSTVGRQFAFIADEQRALTTARPATANTPADSLIWGIESFLRAFRHLKREDVGIWSTTTVNVDGRTVTINWARDLKAPRPPMTAEQQRNLLTPEERRDVERSDRIGALARARAQELAPRVFARASIEPQLLWILYDTRGKELAYDISRGVSLRIRGRGTETDPRLSDAEPDGSPQPLATACGTLAIQFQEMRPVRRMVRCGAETIQVTGRDVSFIVGIADSPD